MATLSSADPAQVSLGTIGFMEPYAVQGATAAQQFLNTPYTPYSGQRIADQSNLTTAGFDLAGGLQTPTATTGAAQQVTSNLLGGLGSLQSFTDPGVSQKYMNPYIGNVLDDQTRRMTEAYQQNMRDYGLGAAQRGAFGGSRQGIAEGLMFDKYLQNLGETTNKGLFSAYDAGAKQFNTEQDQSRQNTQLGFTGARNLFDMGTQGFNMEKDLADYLRRVGGEEEARRQKYLDSDYQTFGEQRDYPLKTLQSYTDIISKLPYPKGSVQQAGSMDSLQGIILPLLIAMMGGK